MTHDEAVTSPITSADPATGVVWEAAYDRLVRFTGDPFALLDPVNAADERFVMGPVFTIAYRLLGGVRPDDPAIVADLERLALRQDQATTREQGHIAAVRLLHAGEFLAAAERWHEVTTEAPEDFAAYRFVHDVCLHIGDDSVRLPSAVRAVDQYRPGSRSHGLANGMAAFAYEESGDYDAAERAGRAALAVDEDDLWARHALAHVYESTAQHAEMVELLFATSNRWTRQDLFANHVWWHAALRLVNNGDLTNAHKILADHLRSTTAFGLADSTSLMWRLRLRGLDVPAGRWQLEADRWADNPNLHACGFLDVHAGLAFAAAGRSTSGLEAGAASAHPGSTFNDETFRTAVGPLLAALGARDGAALAAVASPLRRIGGSVIQRDIVRLTSEVWR